MIATDGAVDHKYLYHFLTWRYAAIRQLAHGGQQQNLNLDIVRALPVAYPVDPEEQLRVRVVLDATCAKPNRAAITLPAFNPQSQRIAIDLQALLAGNDVSTNAGGAPGCMSGGTDPECGPIFANLALGWRPDGSGDGLPVGDGAGQRVFKAIAK